TRFSRDWSSDVCSSDLVSEQRLREFTYQVFKAIGCPDADAELATDVLLLSDLRGIDSHGVARLSGYVRLWENGRLNPAPTVRIEIGRASGRDRRGPARG